MQGQEPREECSSVQGPQQGRVVHYPLGVSDAQNVATLPRDAISKVRMVALESHWVMRVQPLHSYMNSVMHYARGTVTFIHEFSYALCSCNRYIHTWIQLCIFIGQALRSARRTLHLGQALDCLVRKVAFCAHIVFHNHTMRPISGWHVWNFAVDCLQPVHSAWAHGKEAKLGSENTAANWSGLRIEKISVSISNLNWSRFSSTIPISSSK